MRHIAVAIVVAGSLAMGGCAQFDAVTAELTKPQTVAAFAVVKDGLHTLACGLSAAGAATIGVTGQAYNGKMLLDPNQEQIVEVIYAASGAACALSGGVVVAK